MWTQIIHFEIPLKIQEFILQQTTRDLISSTSVFFLPPNWTRYTADNVRTLRLEDHSTIRRISCQYHWHLYSFSSPITREEQDDFKAYDPRLPEHTSTQITNTMTTLLRTISRSPSLCIYVFVLHLQTQENFTTWNTTSERYRSKSVSSARLIQDSREIYNHRRSHTHILELGSQLTSYSFSEWSSDRQRKQAREPTYERKAYYWSASAKPSHALQILQTDDKSWRSRSSRVPVFVSSELLIEEHTRDTSSLETPTILQFSWCPWFSFSVTVRDSNYESRW